MNQKKLMVVDDSMMLRDRIVALVSLHPELNLHVIACAADGVEAIECAKKFKPDSITMDLTMPRMDGDECIALLKQSLPQVKILVVSALSDRATALKILRKGAHGFLLKPFSNEELITTLQVLTR